MAVMVPTFMEVIDTSIASVALPYIAGSVSATTQEATWVLTSYLVANAIFLPSSTWFSQKFGRKRFLIASVILFTAASFACGIAPNLGFLLVARAIQGAGGGALQPISQAILLEAQQLDAEEAHWARRHLLLVEKGVVTDAFHHGGLSQNVLEKLLADIDAQLLHLESQEANKFTDFTDGDRSVEASGGKVNYESTRVATATAPHSGGSRAMSATRWRQRRIGVKNHERTSSHLPTPTYGN